MPVTIDQKDHCGACLLLEPDLVAEIAGCKKVAPQVPTSLFKHQSSSYDK